MTPLEQRIRNCDYWIRHNGLTVHSVALSSTGVSCVLRVRFNLSDKLRRTCASLEYDLQLPDALDMTYQQLRSRILTEMLPGEHLFRAICAVNPPTYEESTYIDVFKNRFAIVRTFTDDSLILPIMQEPLVWKD